MTTSAYSELFNAEAIGKYTPNCFYIRTKSLADLNPENGPAMPGAVPTHAHEYVHYLHNVSTCTGLHIFLANLWLLRSLPHCTDAYGHFLGNERLSKEQRHWITLANTWIKALWGDATWSTTKPGPKAVVSWQFGAARHHKCRLDLPRGEHVIDLVSIEAEAVAPTESAAKVTIDLGHNFISEGIAYEIDREIRRWDGTAETELDRGIPSYPYVAYRPLIEYMVGRPTTAQERVDLGVYALLTTSPAETLIRMSERLGQAVAQPDPNARVPMEVAQDVITPFCTNAIKLITRTLQPELEALGQGEVIRESADEIRALFQAGFALRTLNPVLEHGFLGKRLDAAGFHHLVGNLIDCCVLQEKPGDSVDHMWIGPGIAGRDEQSATRIGRLQAAIHFAQLHVRDDGKLAATAELPDKPCPYSGACATERNDGQPEECLRQPWMRFKDAPQGQSICWYAAGVKSLIHRSSESPRPS